jgi:hypothetical protein
LEANLNSPDSKLLKITHDLAQSLASSNEDQVNKKLHEFEKKILDKTQKFAQEECYKI